MSRFDQNELKVILAKLQELRKEAATIIDFLAEKHWVTNDEKGELQRQLRSFKSNLKAAAKYGTVDGERRPQTKEEGAFFDLTVKQAAANLNVATNSHPIKSSWMSNLYGVRMDLDQPIFQLRQLLEEGRP